MKLYKVIAIALLVLIGVSCTSTTTQNQTLKLNVVHEFVLDELATDNLSSIFPQVVMNPLTQELAFSNIVSPIGIVITDYDGNFIERIGKQGRGPEEISNATFYGFDAQGNIVVLDKSTAFYKRYLRGEKGVLLHPSVTHEAEIDIASRVFQQCGENWYLAIHHYGKPAHPDVPTIGMFDDEFNLMDTFGGYDPYFKGIQDILRISLLLVDCERERIYTTHRKTPYIQVYSLNTRERVNRTQVIPPSFLLSDKSITRVTSQHQMARYMSDEQSMSLMLAHSDDYLFHIYRKGRNIVSGTFQITDDDYYLVAYDLETLEYLGEVQSDLPILGYTKQGYLIGLKNENPITIQFLDIEPVIITP